MLLYAASISKATKFIVDDNFTANKGRAREILRGMIAEGIKTRWSAQVRTDVANDTELLCLMAESGCHTLYIGIESINPATLKAYNKKQDREDIISCIRTVRDHGIHIHGMFVLGADTDDVETIRSTADFATSLGIDTIQFLILTPLPGTPLFHDMMESGRLLHRTWSKYDVQHAVFTPGSCHRPPFSLRPSGQWVVFTHGGTFLVIWQDVLPLRCNRDLRENSRCQGPEGDFGPS